MILFVSIKRKHLCWRSFLMGFGWCSKKKHGLNCLACMPLSLHVLKTSVVLVIFFSFQVYPEFKVLHNYLPFLSLEVYRTAIKYWISKMHTSAKFLITMIIEANKAHLPKKKKKKTGNTCSQDCHFCLQWTNHR